MVDHMEIGLGEHGFEVIPSFVLGYFRNKQEVFSKQEYLSS